MAHKNNFHLLRLLAALQVVVTHVAEHSHLDNAAIRFIAMFPGVPIFFVISGYLVSQSYERTTLSQYALNRALRIFPGLWVCLAVSIAIAAAHGVNFFSPSAGIWILCQATFVQFFNPEFLRGFGVGVLNGSLWTIPVELQFYVTLPLIALLRSNRALVVAIGAGALLNVVFAWWGHETFAHKLVGVTLPVYVYLFLIGMALQRNREFVDRILRGHLPTWLVLYLVVNLAAYSAGLRVTHNLLNPVSATVLALLTVSAAFARAIPLKADLSYGVYLYHMPLLNAALEDGFNLWFVVPLVLALAAGSWFGVERPAMRWKSSAGNSRSRTPMSTQPIAASRRR